MPLTSGNDVSHTHTCASLTRTILGKKSGISKHPSERCGIRDRLVATTDAPESWVLPRQPSRHGPPVLMGNGRSTRGLKTPRKASEEDIGHSVTGHFDLSNTAATA